jgi:hypothetical protein
MITIRLGLASFSAALLATAAASGCSASPGEATSTSESADTASAVSMIACPADNSRPLCPAGHFAVTCKDGSHEIATVAQITGDRVCKAAAPAPAPPPPVAPLPATAPSIYCEPWRYDFDNGRTQTWGDFLVYRGAVVKQQYPQQIGSVRYGKAELTSTSAGFPFSVRVSISDGAGNILEQKEATLASIHDAVSVSDAPPRFDQRSDQYQYMVRCRVELD